MKAYCCDACGNFYKHSIKTKYTICITRDNSDAKLNLCLSCTKKIENILNGGKEES